MAREEALIGRGGGRSKEGGEDQGGMWKPAAAAVVQDAHAVAREEALNRGIGRGQMGQEDLKQRVATSVGKWLWPDYRS